MRRAWLIFAFVMILALSSCAPVYDERAALTSPQAELAGQPLPLPFTEEDLPEGFELSDDVKVYIMTERYYYCPLLYNGEAVANVYLDGYEDGMTADEFTVCSIGFSSSDNGVFSDMLTVCGLGSSSAYDDILRKLGSPTSRSASSNGVDVLTYAFEDGASVTFWCRHGEPVQKLFAVNRQPNAIEDMVSAE